MADNLPPDPFVPGSRQVSAGMLNRVTAQAKEVARMEFDGDTETVAGIRHLSPSPGRAGFWAKLTGEGTDDEAGRYAWTEQELNGYVFSDLAHGRSGTTTDNYAREPNGITGLDADQIVWLEPGDPTEADGVVSDNWLITRGALRTGPAVMVHLSGTTDSDGLYDARIVDFGPGVTDYSDGAVTHVLLVG